MILISVNNIINRDAPIYHSLCNAIYNIIVSAYPRAVIVCAELFFGVPTPFVATDIPWRSITECWT